jgi:hypothetical protein
VTRFEGVLLKPLDQQADRDGSLIDPDGVKFDPDETYTIWREFNYSVPDDVLGSGKIHRAEDGSLIVTGELNEKVPFPRDEPVPWRLAILAIGIKTESIIRGQRVSECELFGIGLTGNHVDPTQPPVVVKGTIRKEVQMIDKAEIEKRFTHHRPDADAQEKHDWARAAFKAFAEQLADSLPDSREKSLAFTALEESSFWAHAAVARAGR